MYMKKTINYRPVLLGLASILAAASPVLAADDPPPPAATRTAEIEAARDAKAADLTPDEDSKVERAFIKINQDKRIMRLFAAGYSGFGLAIGNMVTGGGFAIGPKYSRPDLLNGNLTVDVSAQVSTKKYYQVLGEVDAPKLFNNHLELNFLGAHRDFASIDYYGRGPDSEKSKRTNYRLEDTVFGAIGIVKPVRYVSVGGAVGGLLVNVGPGTNSTYASTDTVFTEANTPGLQQQTNFIRSGVFGQVDFRDNPGGPKSGGLYNLQYNWYDDYRLGQFGFRRMDIDAQQFVPFLNKTHRLALRARATFTESDGKQITPFYLQPVLGGADDLRGFRPFRFSDRDRVVYNAEYQWEIFAGLEGAVFFDAGKVMPRRSLLAFSNLETDAGFGLRFNARDTTFLRVDIGFSHEGFMVTAVFSDFFRSRRLGATREAIY